MSGIKVETLASFDNHIQNILFLWQIDFLVMAALSLSFTTSIPCSKFRSCSTSQFDSLNSQIRRPSVVTFTTVCESKEPPAEAGLPGENSKLEIGSPVIVIEAPKMIKTFASVPCLRVNSGLVKPGDVGRYSYIHLSLQCVNCWHFLCCLVG